MVGQRFLQLLENHPVFEVSALAASSRSAGKKYVEAVDWYLDTPLPKDLAEVEVERCEPGMDADLVFSALPSDVAGEVEPRFAEEGHLVASNASALRMEGDVPLVVPEVNPDHLSLVDDQRRNRGWDGFVVTNPNCSSIILALGVAPLRDLGVEEVRVSTMQAVSGAGYGGVPGMAILDNVVPRIGGEEEKVETEIRKIMGSVEGGGVSEAGFTVSARCNRVPVVDGHLESVWVALEEAVSVGDVEEAYDSFEGEPQRLGLPTAPDEPVLLRGEEDRPQPRLDRNAGNGMTVTVGRPRIKGGELSFTVLGHNTVRGAAGASVLNAELLVETLL